MCRPASLRFINLFCVTSTKKLELKLVSTLMNGINSARQAVNASSSPGGLVVGRVAIGIIILVVSLGILKVILLLFMR
jgi:hypothetical protein